MSAETKIIITAATAQAEGALRTFGQRLEGVTGQLSRFSGLAGALSIGAFAAMVKSNVSAATEYQNALKGLTSVARYAGEDISSTLTKSTKLTEDGMLSVAEAATALKNLLARGFGAEQAVQMIMRLKDAAAFGRQGSLAFGEAVVSATEGIKNNTSNLVDNAGVTKNISVMQKEYAASIGKTIGQLTEAEQRQAIYTGVLKETEAQLGNAELAAQGVEGSTARMNKEFNEAAVMLGEKFTPSVIEAQNRLSEITKAFTDTTREAGLMKGALVAVGAVFSRVFTDDDLSRAQQITKELERLRLETARGMKNKSPLASIFGWVDKNHKDWLNAQNAKMLALQKELQLIQAAEAAAAKPSKGNDKRRGDAPSGGVDEEAQKKLDQLRKQEASVLLSLQKQAVGYQQLSEAEQVRWEIDNGAYQNFSKQKQQELLVLAQLADVNKASAQAAKDDEKAKEEAARAHAKAVEESNQAIQRSALEAQRIIADVDPIYKASLAWEDLTALVDAGLLTQEQAGKSYDKTFADLDKSGTDAFKSLESAVRGWGDAFTNEMTQMVRTGKLNFASLADSIINDLIRIQIQKNITDTLLSAGTSFLGGLFGSSPTGMAGLSAAQMDGPVMASAAGGYDIPSGVNPITQLHEREMVLPAEYADAIRGMARGGNAAPSVTVNIINAPGTAAQVQQRPDGNGGMTLDVITEQIEGVLARNVSRGQGALNSVMTQTYGLNRAAGALR